MIKQYQFKDQAAIKEFLGENSPRSELYKASERLVNLITSDKVYPWDTPFYLKPLFRDDRLPGGYYLCDERGEVLTYETYEYFSHSEFVKYLTEYKEPEGFRLEDLDKTVYISETKGWDVNIEGHFDEDGIKSIIAKLEGLLK